MKVVKNTPDLLILRYRPVPLLIYGVFLTALFLAATVFALFNGDLISTLALAAIAAAAIVATHNQQLMVGIYCDKTHRTVAVYKQRILSRQTDIFAISDVIRFDLEYNGLAERPVLVLRDDTKARPLTRDFHRNSTMSPLVRTANAWISAAR